MGAIATFSLPAEQFLLGRVTDAGTAVEVEQLGIGKEAETHYFWVDSEASNPFERTAHESPISAFQCLDRLPDWELYRGEWAVSEDALTAELVDSGPEVLSGRLRDDAWAFRLGFADLTRLPDFQRHCVQEADLDLQLDRVYKPVVSTSIETELTEAQREALVTAYEEGYFEVPRRTTLVDLAERMELSDQAISERLRRGQRELIRTHVIDDD